MVGALSLWLTKLWTGLDATLIAFTALVALLFLNVISWDDVIRNYKSVDTFFWLGILIMIAEQLSLTGVSDAIGQHIGNAVQSC